MSLVDSPNLEYYEDGKPPEEEPPFFQKHRTRIVLVALLIAAIGLALFSFSARREAVRSGSGVITGQLLDAEGQPLPGVEVYVDQSYQSAVSDASGYFEITAVPVGPQWIIFGVTPDPPTFVSVDVPSRAAVDLGPLTASGR
jgi:hypothetical protein